MCQNCKKLKAEIEKLKSKLDDEEQAKIGNYNAFQDLKEKFERLAVSYCYWADISNPLE